MGRSQFLAASNQAVSDNELNVLTYAWTATTIGARLNRLIRGLRRP